ncbi:MAG: type IV pili methyl-accepting chemotaxis transducer N-terminal domain-containing protein [Candidatus Thiodiazotropha sp. (ex Lucinoma annulata)]|nr:type IV pili methyl-accepting chemotaxis transducer N-terminal domain-containing protein [Candidatus Thiodiazotropha sp. (ex Lucinoma borealis)]MCU7883943.1 type IV pili methyl-accepting chemotaxis transducer N-terminal domain-containing protein [Candidatus Thiodiazotropha sp. (ex Lucinoma annulata)]
MFGYLNHSLLLRAGLAMGLVTVLAVGGMASAVFVARSTHGEAAAVNQAGSLRMQSYHIAAALESEHNGGPGPFGDMNLLTAEFEQRLTNPRLTDVVNTTSRKSIQEVYELITGRWQGTILPLLRDYMEQKNDSFVEESFNKTRLAFRGIVGGFVADIDNLVRLLEEDAESRIHMLGLFQGISLFLTLTVAIATLYLLQIDVLGPLHELLNATEQAGSGNFTARVSHTGRDELGRLGRTFNTMATDLSKIYGALEERVAEKTRKLTQRNQSLELLYTATQYLTDAPVSEQTYRKLLDDIGQVVEIDGITLCRMDERKKRAHRIACNGPIPPMCENENCSLCLGNGITQLLGNMEHGGAQNILSVPVGDKKNNNGVLLVETKPDKELESWQIQLLETLGKHIGISVDVTRRVTQRRRLALLEERSVMARELHDSLAQSLTYLKIQVTRLSVITRSGAEHSAVEDALRELKEGLESAYRQLRELLTTFRLQMDGSGLGPALAKTVEEFNARGNLDIQLDNQLKTSPFTVNEEIHVLQIVREALSNVIHHSKATQARVSLSFGDNKGILVSVEDNGIGLPQKAKRTHHYGLAIMHERSNTLHGNLRIERQDHGGTKVSLRFQPAATQKQFSSQEEQTT